MAYEALEIYRALGDQHGMVLMYANIGGGMVWQGRLRKPDLWNVRPWRCMLIWDINKAILHGCMPGQPIQDLYLGEYQAARETGMGRDAY